MRISTFDLMILALQRTLIYFRGGLLNGIPLLILIKMMTLMTVINSYYQNIRAMRYVGESGRRKLGFEILRRYNFN